MPLSRLPPIPEERPGILAFVLVPVLYALGAAIGSRVAVTPEGLALLWPSNAVLVAAFVRYRGRGWPLFAIGAIGAEIVSDLWTFSVPEALVFGVTNVVESTVAWLLLTASGFDPRFPRLEDVGRFLLAAPLTAAFVGGIVGSILLDAVAGLPSGFTDAALLWWLGDGLGLLVFTPAVLGFWIPRDGIPAPSDRWTAADAAMTFAGLVALVMILGAHGVGSGSRYLRPTLALPFVAYGAARLPFRWACVFIGVLSLIFTGLTVIGRSPYGPAEPALQAVWAQEYVLVTSLLSLGLSALLTNARLQQDALSSAKAEILRRAEDLEQSNAELRRIAFVAAHDLQTPLRAVCSYVQLLGDRYEGRLGQTGDDWIRRASDGATRLSALLRDLGALAAIDTEAPPTGRVSMAAVFEDVVGELDRQLKDAGAVVTRTALPTVRGSRDPLARVLKELLCNAVKFRGDGPLRVHVSAEEAGDEWVFAVRDNGIGIPPAERRRVFELFYRLAASRDIAGTGFGLAMCSRIVHRHGGRIWTDETPGGGSTFFFTVAREARR